jgi:hypothetical protein
VKGICGGAIFPGKLFIDPPRGRRPFLVRWHSSPVGVGGHQPPLSCTPSQNPDPAQRDISGKVRVASVRIPEKVRITSRQFSKKFEQVAEDFKKCLTHDPAIAKKDRSSC